MRFLIVFLLFAFTVTVAHAACRCACVNGSVQTICERSYDIRPVCVPRMCPMTPPSVRPIQKPMVPPIGATRCRQYQVLNPYTGQYEWRTLCR